MRCGKPYRIGVIEHGCGQCMPCRINRSRLWVARLLLESVLHRRSYFCTLTYAPEKLPQGGNLQPVHLQNFMKRLRTEIAPGKVRFYGVGEYGEVNRRPHFHVILFGDFDADVVQKCWAHGFVHVGLLTRASAGYTAGYILKGMTGKDDERLKGLVPEFCRMSLHPGIGAGATEEMIKQLISDKGSKGLVAAGDVPMNVRIGGGLMPLGRYLRGKLREGVGWLPCVPQVAIYDVVRRNKEEIAAIGLEGQDAVRRSSVASAKARIAIKLSKGKL